jgi:exoribonuclease R
MAKKKIQRPKMTLEKLAQITQQGFLELDEKFVTKNDLKQELKRFATKEELYLALDNTKEDIEQETRGATDKLLKEADKIAKKLDTLLQEEKMGAALYRRHDSKLEKHEQRITALESKVSV